MQYAQMSATEIHGLWTFNWNHNIFNGRYPVRQYYIRVRQAMYRELTSNGSCGLIEMYLHADRMNAVLCHAIFNALEAVSDGKELSTVDKEWLVGYGIKFSWYELGRRWNGPRIEVNTAMMKDIYWKIVDVRRNKTERPHQAAGGEPSAAAPETAAPQQPDPRREEPNRQRAAMLEEAKKQRDSILKQAYEQRDGIVEDANVQRSGIITEAERAAARIIDEAKAEAARIREEAEEAARGEAQTLVHRQLGRYMDQQRSQWMEDRHALDNARADMSAAVPTLKEEVCGITTTAGAQMNRSVDAMIEQLNALKSGLLIDLNRWRADLYKCEYGPLINFYTNLVTVAAQFERDILAEQTQPMTEEQELTVLQRHSARMNTLRNNLVRAMEAMGIRTFTPQPGDVFDSYYHAADDAEDDDLYNDRIIESCVSPGVERVVNSQVTDVLHRATVQVRSEE